LAILSPCAHSRPKLMGLGQELNPSPINLPVDGRMALRHFAATNRPPLLPSPQNSQSRRWCSLWGRVDFAEFPRVKGAPFPPRGSTKSPFPERGPQRRLFEFSGEGRGGGHSVAAKCRSAIRPSTGKLLSLGFNSWPSPIIFGRECERGDRIAKHPLCSV
jgi:hypothetical protein